MTEVWTPAVAARPPRQPLTIDPAAPTAADQAVAVDPATRRRLRQRLTQAVIEHVWRELREAADG
ncbi:MAG: hypothetical protein AAF711_01165 [Planctomycetota bacterium]